MSDKGFRFCACTTSRTYKCLLGYFLVLKITYSQDARTDFDEKYVKRRGSVHGCALLGSKNQNLNFKPSFVPKPNILGPVFDIFNIFARKQL